MLLSHVAGVLLNTIKDSLYETQKLHLQEEEDKFPPDLVRSLTIWLQNRATTLFSLLIHLGSFVNKEQVKKKVSVPPKNSTSQVAYYFSDLVILY